VRRGGDVARVITVGGTGGGGGACRLEPIPEVRRSTAGGDVAVAVAVAVAVDVDVARNASSLVGSGMLLGCFAASLV
jgi:hypothetical protein